MKPPTFFLGAHHPTWLERVNVPLFVSLRRLIDRRGRDRMPRPRTEWAMDSGGFTELQQFGEWRDHPQTFGAAVVRVLDDMATPPVFVAPQDWMCEPWIIHGGIHEGRTYAGTGLDVRTHQELTVENYLYLCDEFASCVPWIPVLQGWTLDDYLRCVDMYRAAGEDVADGRLVGLGSVCRRQSTAEISLIVSTLAGMGLALHGFGVKTSGLRDYGHYLVSADSMAWSLAARRQQIRLPECTHQCCANCPRWAQQWHQKVVATLDEPWQEHLDLRWAS